MACFESMYTLKTKAVVFLFGCGSVSLSSGGLNSGFKGAHDFYHIGYSPVVIGFLWTVTDFNTDFCSTKILSAWCNTNQKAHWQCIDKALWKKNGTMGEDCFVTLDHDHILNNSCFSFHESRRHCDVRQPF